jgi:hypothetical protein
MSSFVPGSTGCPSRWPVRRDNRFRLRRAVHGVRCTARVEDDGVALSHRTVALGTVRGHAGPTLAFDKAATPLEDDQIALWRAVHAPGRMWFERFGPVG